jgi:signal transduction histidine kinase
MAKGYLLMKKKNHKVSIYLIFAALGLLISLGVCSLMYVQFHNHIKKTYFDTLSDVAIMIEKQYPFLHETGTIKHAIKNDEDWIWDFHKKLNDIVDSFDLAYIYYFDKSPDGKYVTIFDSSFPREDNRLGNPVWSDTPTPAGVDKAWASKEMTLSPRPSDEGEWGILVSAYLPVVNNDETIGILGADYDISYVNALQRRVLFILGISLLASVVLVCLLAIIGSRSVMVPIEEANEHNRKIESLMKALKLSFATRNAFMSSITSEMTEPINDIIQSSSLMLVDEKIPEEEHKNLEIINDAGIILFNAINDILDLSRLESGKMEFHPANYDLPNLVADTTSLFYTTHKDDESVKFELILEEGLPQKLFGDALHIKTICHRILTNAFKYTKQGTVTFKVSCKREKNGYIWLIIMIGDTGIGMSKQSLDMHLGSYSEINITEKLKTVGTTGLGLYISRRITEVMKGRLIAVSEEGKGSSFTLHIPQKLISEEIIDSDTIEKLKKFEYTKTV